MNSGIDSARLGTRGNPLRVAIVGSGPSGFYAAEALFKSPLSVRVDMLERLPVPFGLVVVWIPSMVSIIDLFSSV